jgi:hypothetical protein
MFTIFASYFFFTNTPRARSPWFGTGAAWRAPAALVVTNNAAALSVTSDFDSRFICLSSVLILGG